MRQEIFMRRLEGIRPPWSDDPILSMYRFTNPYRASDRVSQYLIRHVLYEGDQSIEEVFFRALLFRLFNKIETWERLASALGPLTWGDFDYDSYVEVLDATTGSGQRIYSGAYIIPSPRFGRLRKHQNHLKLLQRMMIESVPDRVHTADSLLEVFNIIRSYPSFGNFLSFQFSIDLNYSEILDFSENDFVAAGPGAQAGIRKCFSDMGGASHEEVIQAVAEVAKEEFEKRDLTFKTLWGRALHLVDYQNLFCEVDKYARVAFPTMTAESTRRRIKRKYHPNPAPLPQWYPPKWKLRVPKALLRSEVNGTRWNA
ncbi:MAG TPA: nucleotide kinase domain-containing protein [Candidatus Bathyarchaeia archaeon]